ncbi:MAG: radical SAM protein [Candidatus Nanohaloarchaea archaeon]|nr:radical SAM protein [Candidatus Nanohaloarchaea archaeon]
MTHEFHELVQQVRHHSFDQERRRYHRFRFSTHDSAAVADCIGSNLRCAHEWGWCEGIIGKPGKGRLYRPEKVAERLETLAADNDSTLVRLSGMEPIMGDDHLLQLTQHLSDTYQLRIDTNGMLLSDGFAAALQDRHDDLRIRLSFKGVDPDTFSRLAQVEPEQFQRQIDAFQSCIEHGITIQPVLAGVYSDEDGEKLEQRLAEIDQDAASRLFIEELRLCPENHERLKEAGFDLS